MKKIFSNIIGLMTIGLAFMACSPEDHNGVNLGQIPVASDYAGKISVDVDQATNTATFTFAYTEGVTPVWVVDGTEYSTNTTFKKYWRKKGEYNVQCFVKNKNGISDGAIDNKVTIEKTKMNGFAGFDVESPDNLMKGVVADNFSTWFANSGWAELDPQPAKPTFVNGEYRFHFDEVGPDRWQGQLAFNHMPVTIEAGKKYDFSMIVTSTKELPGLKIKICNGADGAGDAPVLMDKDFAIPADEPLCVFGTLLEGFDCANDLKIVFDFGGSNYPADVIFENLVIIDHDKNEIEAPDETIPVTWCAVDSPDNLGAGFNTLGTMKFWWADAGWGQVGDPAFSFADGVYTITAVDNGGSEWQGQTSIEGVSIDMEEGAFYDIKCKVVSSAAIGRYTLKICQTDDDNNALFYKGDLKLEEGDNIVEFTHLKMTAAASTMKWIFDFGGTPGGTTLKVSNFILQKHNPK